MSDEYRLPKFTKEQLIDFKEIEKQAMAIPYVKDSIDFLLSVLYELEKYVIEKISDGNRQGLRLLINENKSFEKSNPITIVDRIEQYQDELSFEEKLIAENVKTLITHQMRRLHVDEMYPKSRLKNKNILLLEEHNPGKNEIKKERLIWLAGRGKLLLLISEWNKNQFIKETEPEKVIGNFCDNNGEKFTTLEKHKILWIRKITELVVFISEMATNRYKFITSEDIWVKVCKCFVNKDGSELNPDSLAVTYQKAKPKSKGLIIKIIDSIRDTTQEK